MSLILPCELKIILFYVTDYTIQNRGLNPQQGHVVSNKKVAFCFYTLAMISVICNDSIKYGLGCPFGYLHL